ncbi:HlyD family type I secretion periplasmic adaptor subunit [Camelimonas abortus]|uniref:Membrane fusion protein (MFP) family protein n=1 Tax=Camelimonas abortus TaxID=1017184 RepID=A0ABV7LHI6_9HYPH
MTAAARLIAFLRRRRAAAQAAADREFLPAALEILETPPSPVRMGLLLFIVCLASFTLAWTWFGRFDVVATAQGKVQPAGRVKVVQSALPGKVASAPVPNGARVRAGEVLVQLDDAELQAERRARAMAWDAWRAEAQRREHSLAAVARLGACGGAPDGARLAGLRAARLALPEDIHPAVRRREEALFAAELERLASALEALAARRQERCVEAAGLARAIEARARLAGVAGERVDMRAALLARQAGSRASLLDALEMRHREESARVELEARRAQAMAAAVVIDREARQTLHAFIAEQRQRLSEAARQAAAAQEELARTASRLGLLAIRSPVTGEVQASAITTPGQVVQPGAELMRVVPDGGPLEIEAYLPNRDVGFVAAGQRAVIKVEAFPFTRYGVIVGEVVHVARDAVPEPDARQLEEAAAKELQALAPAGAQRVQNLVFPVRVRPCAGHIVVEGRRVPLSPGMAVTVEITTGRRRILEYLFAPAAQALSEAMRER